MRVLPRMALEAPQEYVEFVERHLPRLRRDAALVVGDGRQADELYPDVLSDVAARWALFELLRRRFRRRDVADAYLRRAFARRAKQWQQEQITPVEVEVWQVERLPMAPPPGSPPATPLASRSPLMSPPGSSFSPVTSSPGSSFSPLWSSMALRLAPVLLASGRLEVRPRAEAAIAWWHAYEARRRRRLLAGLAAFVLAFAMLARVPFQDSDVFSAPVPTTSPAEVR